MANEKAPAKLVWADNALYSPSSGARPLRFLKLFSDFTYFAREHSDYSLGYADGICFDGSNSVYMSMSRIRTNVVKLDINSMKWTYYDLGVDRFGAYSLAIGGGYLWVGCDRLYRCDPTDPTIKTEVVLSGLSITYITALAWDGSYIWAYNDDGVEGKILRIHPTTFAYDVVYHDPAYDWCTHLHYAFGKIWAGFDMAPLYILRIDPSTLAYDTLIGAADENECYSITDDGVNIFVPTCDWDTTEIRILRINPTTLAYDRAEISGYYNGYGAAFGETYIWVSVQQDPGAYVRLNPSTLAYDVITTDDVNAYRINTFDLKYLKWQIALDTLVTTDTTGNPCISYDNETYVTSAYVSGGSRIVRAKCIDLDGDVLWSVGLPSISTEPSRCHVSTPIITKDGNKVIFVIAWYYDAGGGVAWVDIVAQNTSDGSNAWQRYRPEGFFYGVGDNFANCAYSQPAIDKDGYIYAQLYANVYKINPADGSIIWTKTSQIGCTPALSPDGLTVYITRYVTATNRALDAYELDGTSKWSYSGLVSGSIYTTVDEAGKIYVYGGSELYCIDADGNSVFTKTYTSVRGCVATASEIYAQDVSRIKGIHNTPPYTEWADTDMVAEGQLGLALNACYNVDGDFIIFPFCTNNKIRRFTYPTFPYVADILSLDNDARYFDIHMNVAVGKTASYTANMIFTTQGYVYCYQISAEPRYTFQTYFASHGSDYTNRRNSDGSSAPALKTLTVYVEDDADAPISTAHVIVNGNEGDTDSDGMVQFSLTTGVTVTATASKTAWGGYEGLESEEVTMDADKTITLRLTASSIKKLPIDITGPGDIIWL